MYTFLLEEATLRVFHGQNPYDGPYVVRQHWMGKSLRGRGPSGALGTSDNGCSVDLRAERLERGPENPRRKRGGEGNAQRTRPHTACREPPSCGAEARNSRSRLCCRTTGGAAVEATAKVCLLRGPRAPASPWRLQAPGNGPRAAVPVLPGLYFPFSVTPHHDLSWMCPFWYVLQSNKLGC